MTTFERAWRKLAQSKSYREEFALAMLKRMVPFQIRAIRKKRALSQAELAQCSNVTQGVISRAENPDYGNLTLNTIGKIAAGFDLAFIGRFVPFSELVKFSEDLSEAEFKNLSKFEDESAIFQKVEDGPMPPMRGRTNNELKTNEAKMRGAPRQSREEEPISASLSAVASQGGGSIGTAYGFTG